MVEKVKMPKIGLKMDTGKIKKIYKNVGENVKKGEPLFQVATGKMNSEIESPFSGMIKEIYVKTDDDAAVGAELLSLEVMEGDANAEAAEKIDVAAVKIPKIGTAAKATLKKWQKKEGDAVKADEVLCSVNTGKMNHDIVSPMDGILLKICKAEEEAAQVGEIIAYVGEEGAAIPQEEGNQADSLKQKIKITIIGGGPGGYVAAIKAAQMGAEVVLIEKKDLGGTCLNVGCIPTKAILHCAETYESCKHAEDAGVLVQNVTYDWEKIQSYKRGITKQLTDGIASLLYAYGVEVLQAEASFANEKELEITLNDGSKRILQTDKVILATGSVPAIPPIPGLKEVEACIDSTKALSLEKVPESMAIIGGGVIGVELACAYASFGTKITVIEMQPKLMPMMDGELVSLAQSNLEKMGIQFLMETQVLAVEEDPVGGKVKVKTKDGEESYITAEKILVAVGRRTNTESLRLDNAGIANDRGRITVNDYLETNVPGIYAIGDCVGKIMLAHVASAMGEVAVSNIFGKKERFSAEINPACVYLSPEFAGVGLTEEAAKSKNVDYKVGKFPLMANGKSLVMGCQDGWIKVLVDKMENKLIGCHILGPRATDLIAEAALAIAKGVTVSDIDMLIHAHPTVAEAFREAVLASENRAIHSM